MELFLLILACMAASLGCVVRFIRRTSSILDWRAGLGPEKAEAPQNGEETFKESLAEMSAVSEK
jgi:hypothetical protein